MILNSVANPCRCFENLLYYYCFVLSPGILMILQIASNLGEKRSLPYFSAHQCANAPLHCFSRRYYPNSIILVSQIYHFSARQGFVWNSKFQRWNRAILAFTEMQRTPRILKMSVQLTNSPFFVKARGVGECESDCSRFDFMNASGSMC